MICLGKCSENERCRSESHENDPSESNPSENDPFESNPSESDPSESDPFEGDSSESDYPGVLRLRVSWLSWLSWLREPKIVSCGEAALRDQEVFEEPDKHLENVPKPL